MKRHDGERGLGSDGGDRPTRREALRALGGLASLGVASRVARGARSSEAPGGARPSFLVLTADDLDYGSLGVTGDMGANVTPNLDRLAAEGHLFTRAHVTVSSCKPSRQSLVTGRVPHRFGPRSWGDIDGDVPTLPELLAAAGYSCGILGKVDHCAPVAKLGWDLAVDKLELGLGRDPEAFRRHASAFVARAREEGRPFFLLANSSDPHRPFAGSSEERSKWARLQERWQRDHPDEEGPGPFVPPLARRTFAPEELTVPAFLPDLPGVRAELAGYFRGVSRMDRFVGAMLDVLDEAGLSGTTHVTFLGDNGMAFPFAKGNVYRHSTRTPWIVRWPGEVAGGRRDDETFVSGVDLLPSLLGAAGVDVPEGVDGCSYLPALGMGERDAAPRPHVVTYHDDTAAGESFPMRAIHDARFTYVVNLWDSEARIYENASTNGGAFQALKSAARTEERYAARLRRFRRRPAEELYDAQEDPGSLTDLASEPAHAKTLARLRRALLEEMVATNDPHLEAARRTTRD